jgi:hypothetical protein
MSGFFWHVQERLKRVSLYVHSAQYRYGSFLILCFPGLPFRYFLNDFWMVPVVPIITGITFCFYISHKLYLYFHVRCIVVVVVVTVTYYYHHQQRQPKLTSNEFLSVQIETVMSNGQTTINPVEKLLSMVTDFITEVARLKSDNAILKVEIKLSLRTVKPYGSSRPDFVLETRNHAIQGHPSKQSTLSTGEDCEHNQNSKNVTSSTQKSMIASAVAEVSTKKNGLC